MGSMSDHFNRMSVGEGAMGLLKRAAHNGDTETLKKLLGHAPPAPDAMKLELPDKSPPAKLPLGHPRGFNGADDVTYAPDTTMDVMRPAEVHKRTEADRGKKDIQLIGAVTIKKRKPPGAAN